MNMKSLKNYKKWKNYLQKGSVSKNTTIESLKKNHKQRISCVLLISECMPIAFSPYGPHQSQRNHFPYVWWMFTTHVLQPSNKSITFFAKPYSSQKVGKQISTSHSPPCNQFFSPNLTYFEEKIFVYFQGRILSYFLL